MWLLRPQGSTLSSMPYGVGGRYCWTAVSDAKGGTWNPAPRWSSLPARRGSTRVRESALQNPGQALGHPGVGAVQAVLVVHSHARRGVPKACHDVSCGGADGRRQ